MVRPGLVRVAVGNGLSVAIHRGGAMDMASSQGGMTAGVRVHRGTDSSDAKPDAANGNAASELASKVTIHRGTSLGEADPI